MVNELARDLAAAADPVQLARTAGIQPDPWQADILRSTEGDVLLNVTRQGGKSETAATLSIHTALYVPESLTLLLSPGLRQSQELFRKCLKLYRRLGRPVPAEAENKLTLELTNGSRIVSLPGSESTVRGYSNVALLVTDEAARVEDELYRAVRPMLAVSGGRLIALSTPWGRRGWFSEAWHSSESWQRVEITAEQCPRISPAFLAAERKRIGDFWFRQEYLCEFLDAETAAFTMDEVRLAFGEKVETWEL